jgi:hypothetical protein
VSLPVVEPQVTSETLPDCRPEVRLLLACARAHPDASGRERLREAAAAAIHWPVLLAAAQEHGLTSLVYKNLKETCLQRVPEAAMTDLKRRFLAEARRSLSLYCELLRSLATFEEAGVPVIALRGPLFASAAYGDVTLRSFGDLDLLVRPSDVARSRKLLEKDGMASAYPLSDPQGEALQRFAGAQFFPHPQGSVAVDLHWRLGRGALLRCGGDTDVWTNSVEVDVEGTKTRTLGPIDMLIHLCAHGLQHTWEKLSYVSDVAEFVNGQPDLDWHGALEAARREGRLCCVGLGLLLAARLLRTSVPAPVLARAASRPGAESLFEETARRLLRLNPRDDGNAGKWSYQMRALERVGDKLKILAFPVFVPTILDIRRVPLPRPLFWLYYPLRVGRLALKHTVGRLTGQGDRRDRATGADVSIARNR